MNRCLAVIGLAVLAGCLDGAPTTGPEQGAGALAPSFKAVHLDRYNAREPWTMNLTYNCAAPLEAVSLSGIMHTVSMRHVDGNGVDRWSFHSHPIQMRGVGSISGREFRVVGAESTTRQIYPDNFRHFHQTALLRLMTPGEPAWTVKVLVDREGTPGNWTYRINRFEVECR